MDSPIASIPSSPARRPEQLPRRETNATSGNSASSSSSALLQHEIDMWMSLAGKSKVSKKQLEEEADALLMAHKMTKLRELQKEICDTDWMFDNVHS